MALTTKASEAWKFLNGLVCVYKPAGLHPFALRQTIISNLCRDLNQMDLRPPDKIVQIIGKTNFPMQVKLVKDLSDNPLVLGPQHQNVDFKVRFGTYLGKHTSGLFLLGINGGINLTYKIHNSRPTRAYKIHGQFGLATDTYFSNGKVVEKATYKYVTREKIDAVVAHMQAMHQQKMYELSGLDMQSQAGYELAKQGLIRPSDKKIPVIYGMKCVHFDRPNFIIEIQAVNEYEKYLHSIIHEIGIQLKTVAHCTAAQCIRQGKFTLDHALLKKHWQLDHIMKSMEICQNILDANTKLLRSEAILG